MTPDTPENVTETASEDTADSQKPRHETPSERFRRKEDEIARRGKLEKKKEAEDLVKAIQAVQQQGRSIKHD